jgi:dienelactone hydrolase
MPTSSIVANSARSFECSELPNRVDGKNRDFPDFQFFSDICHNRQHFQMLSLLLIAVTLTVNVAAADRLSQWSILGPFPIGKGEVDGDPSCAQVSTNSHNCYSRLTPRTTTHDFYSELVPSGKVKWLQLHSTQTISRSFSAFEEAVSRRENQAVIQFPVDWNDLVTSLSSTSVMEFQATAYAELNIDSPGRFAVHCDSVHSVLIDSSRYLVGDMYGKMEEFSVIKFESAGLHTIHLRIRAKVQASFACQFVRLSASDVGRVWQTSIVPDIVDKHLSSPYFAVKVFNSKSHQIHISRVEMVLSSPFNITVVGKQVVSPGQNLVLALELHQLQPNAACPVRLRFRLVGRKEGSSKDIHWPATDLELRCRSSASQTFLFTFLDHDGAVTQAGVAVPWPTSRCALSGCAVTLSLHGTGVSASDQADAYKFKAAASDKEYTFGVNNSWLLTPHRFGAHNHEQIGLLSAWSAMSALQARVAVWMQQGISKFAVDVNRVLMTGHSMGGHGAWMMATHRPDSALCVVASAGWLAKEHYHDSNRLYDMDVSLPHADAALRSVLQATILQNSVDMLLGNLVGMPVYARVGALDRTVHPFFVRKMMRILKEAGANEKQLSLVEFPKMEHWWFVHRESVHQLVMILNV